MYRKLALAVLTACNAALGSIITPVQADTLTGCMNSFGTPCSDAFFLNGVPIPGTMTFDNGFGLEDLNVSLPVVNVTLDRFVVYIFTEEGTGTSDTAPVSDIVQTLLPNTLVYINDPLEVDVAGVRSAFPGPEMLGKIQVVEETGSPQSLTAFNPDLAIQFGSDVAAVPGPIAGAGVPGLILACGILLVLARRRQQIA
jgi:hypothetical protein